jgi:hypothetical protein
MPQELPGKASSNSNKPTSTLGSKLCPLSWSFHLKEREKLNRKAVFLIWRAILYSGWSGCWKTVLSVSL